MTARGKPRAPWWLAARYWLLAFFALHLLGWLLSIYIYFLPGIIGVDETMSNPIGFFLGVVGRVFAAFFWEPDFAMDPADFRHANAMDLFLFYDVRRYIALAMLAPLAMTLLSVMLSPLFRSRDDD